LALKNTIVDLLCSRPLQAVLNPMVKNQAVIFMLHRFASSKHGTSGHDPELVDESLSYLKHIGRNVISLDDLFRSLTGEIEPVPNAIVYTLDDGFCDQAEVGASVFIEHGCPVTIGMISELASQRYWLAENRIAYIVEHSIIISSHAIKYSCLVE